MIANAPTIVVRVTVPSWPPHTAGRIEPGSAVGARDKPAVTVPDTPSIGSVRTARRIKRRGGFEPPRSTAQIPPSLMLHNSALSLRRSRCLVTPERSFSAGPAWGVRGCLERPIDDVRGQKALGATRSERVPRSTRVPSPSCHRVAPPVRRKHRSVAPGCPAHCAALRSEHALCSPCHPGRSRLRTGSPGSGVRLAGLRRGAGSPRIGMDSVEARALRPWIFG